MPLLTDRTLKLLKAGILYIHGRGKDGSPVMYIEMGKIIGLLAKKEIDPGTFTSIHAYVTQYMIRNMMIPGQVEKSYTIANI